MGFNITDYFHAKHHLPFIAQGKNDFPKIAVLTIISYNYHNQMMLLGPFVLSLNKKESN